MHIAGAMLAMLPFALRADEPAVIPTSPSGAFTTASAGPETLMVSPVALERQRVVLLKNDRCLSGVVRLLGDQVVIEIDNNATVAKSTSEVQFIGDDLESIYRYKLSRFSQLGPGEHIRLARWSLAVGLHNHAAEHFLAVNRESGDHPVVKQLGIELREQLLKDVAFRDYLGLPAIVQYPIDNSTTAVRSASTSGDSTATPIVPAVLSTFADHVQPILLKRCSQSGCHGLSATNRLKFVQPLGNARARISEQNCRSVLQFVEVDESNMSSLLRYAVVQHGMQKSPAIAAQETKLIEALQSWTTFARNPVMAAVEQQPVGSTTGAATPAVYNDTTKRSVPAPLAPLAPGATQLPGTKSGSGSPIGQGQAPTQREIDELDDQVRKALGEPPRQADPFDPSEFNRGAASQPTGPR